MDVVSLTRELIRFNTINPPGKEEDVAKFIGDLLEAHGFQVEYPQYAPERPNVVASKGLSVEVPPILLSGHLDVVPLGNEPWTIAPFEGEIKDDKLYGRGSSDMKSGVAAMIVAAIESFTSLAPRGGIKLVFTANEELGCLGASHLRKNGYDLGAASAIVVGEPTSNQLFLAHKGGLYLKATTRGRTAHSSMPELGVNAIYKAATAIAAIAGFKFETEMDEMLGYPTVNVGQINGGMNLNTVPDHAEFTVDIRSTTKLKNDAALHQIQKLVGTEVKLEKLVDLDAISTDAKHPFVELAYSICYKGKGDGGIKSAPFLTDASVLTPWLNNVPTIIMGPGEIAMAHQTDEFCYLYRIREALELYKEIIKENSRR